MATSSASPPLHVMLFPFMSKGHTIPLLDLAKLIHRHRPSATFTVFTTTGNCPFISDSLSSSIPPHLLTIISYPFPHSPAIPPGVESTDKLPSMSLFVHFVDATERLFPLFKNTLENLQIIHQNTTACFLVSDGFLHWTQEPAAKFNIPRLEFYGMSSYAQTLTRVLVDNGTLHVPEGDDQLIQVPDFPWIQVTRNDLDRAFSEKKPKSHQIEFVIKTGIATSKSYGLLVNTFYEIESKFLDYANSKYERTWPIGPLCLAQKPLSKRSQVPRPAWLEWLDRKWFEGKPVMYVAFGSQAEISNEQLKEIVMGLEKSGVNFLWALRINPEQEEFMEGFEERAKERGLVVRGWIEQREVLNHDNVQGFLSHCGWNSVIESISAGVPILAWPMMAEQFLNARMVTEEIKVGLRVETCNGSVRGFVKWEGLSEMVKELMGGEIGKVVHRKVKELSEAAKKAIEEGGTSWCSLELLLKELESKQIVNYKNVTVSNGSRSSSTPLICDGSKTLN